MLIESISWPALNAWLESKPKFKSSSIFPLSYYLFSFLRSALNIVYPASKRKNSFLQCDLSKLCWNTQGKTHSSCGGTSSWKPCPSPFAMAQRAFVAFPGEMVEMLVSISGPSWCSGWHRFSEEIWV